MNALTECRMNIKIKIQCGLNGRSTRHKTHKHVRYIDFS